MFYDDNKNLNKGKPKYSMVLLYEILYINFNKRVVVLIMSMIQYKCQYLCLFRYRKNVCLYEVKVYLHIQLI